MKPWDQIVALGLLLGIAGCGGKSTDPVAPNPSPAPTSKWDKTETNGPTNWLGVWVSPDSAMYVVGRGKVARFGPPPIGDTHWTYSGTDVPTFNGVNGASGGVVAVSSGGRYASYIPSNNSPGSWVLNNSATVYDLWSVWGITFAGSFGAIVRGVMVPTGTTEHLFGIWGPTWDNMFAVGAGGTILRYDGNTWTPMTSGTNSELRGVWGNSDTDVFAVGAGGVILHYDGNGWSPQTSQSTANLRGVWGSSGSNVFAVGDNGTILRHDGNSWEAMESGVTANLRGVSGSSAAFVYVVGDGTILHYKGQ